jgi:hypothetical protein
MPKSKRIFIHCSDSDWGSAVIIDGWHKARGWTGIGYHFVVGNGMISPSQRNPWDNLVGSIEAGRSLDDNSEVKVPSEVGSHVFGFNYEVGICLIGKHNFHEQQIIQLRKLIEEIQTKYSLQPHEVYGHCEAGSLDARYAVNKTCPNIPMNEFRGFLKDQMTLREFMQLCKAYNELLINPTSNTVPTP